jgi:hypothetical protein
MRQITDEAGDPIPGLELARAERGYVVIEGTGILGNQDRLHRYRRFWAFETVGRALMFMASQMAGSDWTDDMDSDGDKQPGLPLEDGPAGDIVPLPTPPEDVLEPPPEPTVEEIQL